ncbi:AraC family transcriptional regulator [Cystobacter fuscus]|uniref:AraC family transcriptional regulator n=1 Tax=Cystobacter fuscus TaxID=43 RepID=UPI002B30C5A9|nr:AraC family transcriptional regulator [Cystobacter fuscus]
MDVLAEVMSLLRTQGQLYGRLELSAPFGLKFPGNKGICLIVTRGSCLLIVDGREPIPLVGGDFVFLPSPKTYTLVSGPREPVRPATDVVSPETFHRTRLFSHGGKGTPVSVIAGCFTFESPESEMLVKHLPAIVHLPASSHESPWFGATLQHLAAETMGNQPGSAAIVDRLAEVLFVQAMRSQIHSMIGSGSPSWLRAIADPQIGEALRLMHAEPARNWTVPALAEGVSMSRSAFAERFRKLVGETPLDHLTRWRMVRAAAMLRERRPIKMAAVANAVGYESESSFGKVFKRVMNVSPGGYRLCHHQGAETDSESNPPSPEFLS